MTSCTGSRCVLSQGPVSRHSLMTQQYQIGTGPAQVNTGLPSCVLPHSKFAQCQGSTPIQGKPLPRTFAAVQDKYGFKAREFHAAGFANVAEYKKEHGSDLFIRDIDEYDRICKVMQPARQFFFLPLLLFFL